MKEKSFALGDEFTIKDADGRDAFFVVIDLACHHANRD